MKNLVLLFIIISFTFSYSQWEPVEGLYGGRTDDIISIEDTLFLTAGSLLYVSTNNGKNWTQNEFFKAEENFYVSKIINFNKKIFTFTLSREIYAYDLQKNEFRKLDDDIIKNTNYLTLEANENYLFLSTNDYIYRSNSGSDWEIIDTNSSTKMCVYENNIVYQYLANNIFLSTNNGDDWKDISPDFLNNIQKLEIHMNEKYIFSSYRGLLIRTSDMGETWETIPIYGELKNFVSSGNITIFSDDEFIYFSEDYGKTWIKKPVLLHQDFIQNIFIKDSTIFLSTQRDLYKSTDWGETWELSNTGIKNFIFYNFINFKENLLATTFGHGICEINTTKDSIKKKYFQNESFSKIFRYDDLIIAHPYMYGGLKISTDYGESWYRADTNNGFTAHIIKSSIFFDSTIIASTLINGIFISKDSGKVWTKFHPNYQNVTASDTFAIKDRIRSFSIVNDKIYVGTDHKGLFYFTPEDYTNWTKIKTEDYFIDRAKHIFYAVENKNKTYLNCDEKMYVSNDDGSTWEQIFTDYEDIEYRNIAFYDDHIIVSTSKGVYLSLDNSNTLIPVNEGMGTRSINDIIIVNNTVYVSTSAGAYYRDINELILSSVEDTETRNYLYSYPPYPIPAKTQVNTIIYWDKNISMDVESIKIYDINGMEVGRQEDISLEQETAYKGRLIWNCASVPDGVYLIHIKHGNNTKTIKVIVNK